MTAQHQSVNKTLLYLCIILFIITCMDTHLTDTHAYGPCMALSAVICNDIIFSAKDQAQSLSEPQLPLECECGSLL